MSLDPDGSANPVRQDAHRVMEDAEHVSVNDGAVETLAADLADEYDFSLASWDAPVYPSVEEHGAETVIDFIMVGNALNYCFNDPETGEKYTVNHQGTEWRGAFGMWAALHRAFEDNIPILDADYLAVIDREDVEEVFKPVGNVELPMMDSRVEQLNAIGEYMQFHGGTHANLFEEDVTLYGDGGLAEHLGTFPAYRDARSYDGETVRFDKRAQLTISMLYGKLRGTIAEFEITDIDEFTIFADYGIPAGLHATGVLEYSDNLATHIEEQKPIPENDPMEVELRAATVVAGDRLKAELESTHDQDVIVPVLDYVLWQMRNGAETNPHITLTTAY